MGLEGSGGLRGARCEVVRNGVWVVNTGHSWRVRDESVRVWCSLAPLGRSIPRKEGLGIRRAHETY